jgi:hypothetical protein
MWPLLYLLHLPPSRRAGIFLLIDLFYRISSNFIGITAIYSKYSIGQREAICIVLSAALKSAKMQDTVINMVMEFVLCKYKS